MYSVTIGISSKLKLFQEFIFDVGYCVALSSGGNKQTFWEANYNIIKLNKSLLMSKNSTKIKVLLLCEYK